MATKVWQSADGNWDTAASWTGGVKPASNDVAIFPENNSVSVSSGLSQAAVDLDALIVQPGYRGDIGLSGTHLNISADRVLHEGSGQLFYTDGDGTTDEVIINANGGGAVLVGTALTRIVAMQGNIVIDGSAGAIAKLEVSYYRSRGSDANVTIENGAGTITSLVMNGGVVSCSAVVSALVQQSGTFVQESTGGAIAAIYQAGGTCTYKGIGTIPLAYIIGGVLDCSKVVLTSAKLIISDLKVFPGAKAITPTDLVTISAGGELLARITPGDPT